MTSPQDLLYRHVVLQCESGSSIRERLSGEPIPAPTTLRDFLTSLYLLNATRNFRDANQLIETNQSLLSSNDASPEEKSAISAQILITKTGLGAKTSAVPKFDWYQSATQVTVSYKIKNPEVFKTRAEVTNNNTMLEFSTEDSEGQAYTHRIPLYSGAARTIYGLEVKPMKVDVILTKAAANQHWQSLEAPVVAVASSSPLPPPPPASASTGTPSSTATPQVTAAIASKSGGALPTPYASKKNWSELEKQAKQEEEEEGKTADDPLAKLLRQIYQNADEDTRRAMNKSYQTSAGTVLTTNWKEAAQKDFEKTMKAPKGQVFKDWQGNVIADDVSSESSLSEEEEEGAGKGVGNPELDALMRERRRKRREEKLEAKRKKKQQHA